MQCSFFPFFNHSEQNVPNLRRQTSCLLTVCGAAICMRNGLRPIRGDVFLTSLMQRPSVFFSATHISSEPHCVVTSHYTLGYNVLNQILTFVCFSFITYNEQI